MHCSACRKPVKFSGGVAPLSEGRHQSSGGVSQGLVNQQAFGIKLPLCRACLGHSVSLLSAEIAKMKYALEEYTTAVQDFKATTSVTSVWDGSHVVGPDSADAREDRLFQLKTEVSGLESAVVLTQAKRAVVQSATERLKFSENWWRDHSARMWRHFKATEVLNACQQRAQAFQERLCKLQTLTVCNDVFFIWSEAQFGTINGLRLGTLQGQAVDWAELNAALGYVALLLTSIARWTGCTFMEYRIVPQGSFSKLTKVGDERKTHDLYLANRMFWGSKFNQSLKCLLQCMKELMEFAMNKDQSLAIPYRIADGKINDVTVDVERPVTWTRAMKYLLTNLKWLTAWAAAWRRGSVKMDV